MRELPVDWGVDWVQCIVMIEQRSHIAGLLIDGIGHLRRRKEFETRAGYFAGEAGEEGRRRLSV